MIKPPDIRTLLEDPTFAKFMRTRPRMPANATHPSMPPAWAMWVLLDTDKWRTAEFRVYDDAYKKMKQLLKNDRVVDLSIVSKRVMMPPPEGLSWAGRQRWCGRCRRPSLFRTSLGHRALRGAELTLDDPERCFYCGIRLVALPRYSPV